jgi:hypothetical protein
MDIKVSSATFIMKSFTVAALLFAAGSLGQQQPPGVTQPIVEACGPDTSVVCVNRYVRAVLFHG